MSDKWEKVDAREFLSDVARAAKEGFGGVHHFKMRKRLPWPCCQGCGLLLLRNKATEKAVKRGCFK